VAAVVVVGRFVDVGFLVVPALPGATPLHALYEALLPAAAFAALTLLVRGNASRWGAPARETWTPPTMPARVRVDVPS
jgi:hypothetical protein